VPVVRGEVAPLLIDRYVSVRYESILNSYLGCDRKGNEAWVGTAVEEKIIKLIRQGDMVVDENGNITKT